MRSALRISLLVAVATLGVDSPGRAASLPRDASAHERADAEADAWREAGEAYDRGDCVTTLKLLVPRLQNGAVGDVPEKLLAMGYDAAASCDLKGDKPEDAYNLALRGTAFDAASDWLWQFRLGFELDKNRLEAGVATVERMTMGRGAVLNAVPIRWMYTLNRKLKDQHQPEARRRLLAILAGNGYAPVEVFATADGFRQDYAEILYDTGDHAGAAALVRGLTNPGVANEVSFDPRLRSMLPRDFDLRRSVEQSLARVRDVMDQHPDLLEPIVEVARHLRQLGRTQEAAVVLESARASVTRTGAYTDADEQLNWWWDGLARTYKALGKYDQAIAALRSGMDVKEGGGLNVSQTINLAEAQLEIGRPADALTTLAAFDTSKRPVSPYGAMEMHYARGCANALTGNKDKAAADLAFAISHDTDHPEALSNLLLCVGDLDGAAAAFVRRLDDPDRRTRALLQLSDYDAAPVPLVADPVYSKIPALKSRADVRAAIARAGGARRIHVQRDEL